MEDFIKAHKEMFQIIVEFIAVIIAYVAIILPIYKNLQDKRRSAKNRRFDEYHKLIQLLVKGEPDASGKTELMLDRQIAVVYELRNYSEKYPVTKRVLNHYREKSLKDDLAYEALRNEITLAIQSMDKCSIYRVFPRLIKWFHPTLWMSK